MFTFIDSDATTLKEFESDLISGAPVVVFDTEGTSLGRSYGTLEFVSLAIFSSTSSTSSSDVLRIIKEGQPLGKFVIDVNDEHGSAEAREILARALTNPSAVWVGWGIRSDLGAMFDIVSSTGASTYSHFIDLQVGPSEGYLRRSPPPKVDFSQIKNLVGLATFMNDTAKTEFQRNVYIEMLERPSPPDFIQRPITANSKSVMYSWDDVQLTIEAARKVFKSTPATEFERLDNWSSKIAEVFFAPGGKIQCDKSQLSFAEETALLAKSPRLHKSVLDKYRHIKGRYGRVNAVKFLSKLLRQTIELLGDVAFSQATYSWLTRDTLLNSWNVLVNLIKEEAPTFE